MYVPLFSYLIKPKQMFILCLYNRVLITWLKWEGSQIVRNIR